MNKAEAKNGIKEMVEYLISDPVEQVVIDSYTETFMLILDKYADEQSREEAVKYGKWYANNRPLTIEVDHNYYNVYDEWKSKEGER